MYQDFDGLAPVIAYGSRSLNQVRTIWHTNWNSWHLSGVFATGSMNIYMATFFRLHRQ